MRGRGLNSRLESRNYLCASRCYFSYIWTTILFMLIICPLLNIIYCPRIIFDIDIDTTFEEKPWKYPGAEISDFFNFGLDEEKWKDYCKQLVSPCLTFGSNIVFSPSLLSFCKLLIYFSPGSITIGVHNAI